MDTVFYSGKDHPLSHFFPCKICMFGMEFNSAEQVYQFVKSKAVHEFESSVQVMATDSSAGQKRIGGNISIPGSRWDNVKEMVMLRIDYEKVRGNLNSVIFTFQIMIQPFLHNILVWS